MTTMLPAPATPVTVVVATRDRREQLLATWNRIAALPERPAVVVVDNGSADGTPAAVRQAFPGGRVIEAYRNLGAVARTVGARAATTPYVAFADDDSWWDPGSLERASRHFEEDSRLGLLAARIVVGPGRLLDPVCAQLAASPLPVRSGSAGPAVLGFVAYGAVVRRDAYLAVGGFDRHVFFFGEETVLAQDLRAAGWLLAYVPDVVAVHDPGARRPDGAPVPRDPQRRPVGLAASPGGRGSQGHRPGGCGRRSRGRIAWVRRRRATRARGAAVARAPAPGRRGRGEAARTEVRRGLSCARTAPTPAAPRPAPPGRGSRRRRGAPPR